MPRKPTSKELLQKVSLLQEENQRLKERVTRFENLIENTGIPMGVYDPDGVLLMMSKSGAANFGGVPQDFIGRRISEFMQGNTDIYVRRIKKAVETGVPEEHEDEVSLPVGRKWFHSTYQPVKDGTDRISGVQISSIDITERKRAEDALRESTANVRAIITNPADSILLVNPDGIIIETNQTFAQCIGRRVDELIGRCVYDFLPPELAKSRRARVDEIVRLGVPVRFEDERAGMWLDQSAHPVFDAQGRVVRIAVIARDITERKQLEEKMRLYMTMFECSNEAIAISNPEGRMVYINSAHEKLFGRSLEVARQMNYREFYPQESIEVLDRQVSPRLARGEGWEGELEAFDVAGRLFPLWERADSILDSRGELLYAFGFMHDITERKKADESLWESEQKYRTFFDEVPVGIAISTIEGKIIDANKAQAEMIGCTVEELKGRNVNEYYVYPDKRKEMIEVFKKDRKVREFEMQLRRKDGSIITELLNLGEVQIGGKDFIFATGIDITERKRAEKALRESEKVFSRFMERSPIYIFFKDDQIRSLRLSTNYEKMLGKPLKDLLGKTMDDLFPSDLAKSMIADDLRILREEKEIVVEEELNGRHYSTIKFPIHIDGKPRYLAGYTIDITERKQAEEALQKSEALYREAQRVAHIGHWKLDISTGMPTWSEEIFRIFGLDPGQGEPSFEAHQKVIHPDDWPLLYNAVTTASREGIPFDIDFRLLRPDKGIRWMKAAGQPIRDSEGRIISVFGTAQDITERKKAEEALRESEERYRSVVESSSDGIGISCENKRVYVNKRFLEIFGYTSPDEVLGKPSSLIVHLDDLERYAMISRRRERGGMAPSRYEFKALRKGGEVVHVEVVVSRIVYGGKPCSLTFVRDISARKKVEQELRENQEQLFQAQKMETLGTLVAGVAHEINNPINLIMLNVPLLQKVWRDIHPILEKHALHEPHEKYGGLTSEFLKQNLDKLLRDMNLAVNRVARIVSGLKDFAKMSDIRDKTPIQINDAVTNAMRLAQTTLKKAGIDVELELGQDLPLIEGNLQGLEQIVLNLIVNASQAIEHENGRIRVKTGLDERKGQIVVVVSDNGKGIDPSIYARIFDPFFSSRQADGGTGLGLAVSYSLTKAHDGEITFESEVGRGTTFTLTLPATLRGSILRTLAKYPTITERKSRDGPNTRQ